MAERLPIEELSRQPLVRGTSCFTTPDGYTGYKTEDVQVSALVRIAAALETQNKLLGPQTAHLEILARHEQAFRAFVAETAQEWEVALAVVSTAPAQQPSVLLVEVAYPLPALLFSLGKLWESRVAEGLEQEGGPAGG